MSLRTDLWQRGRDHLELGVTWSCPLRQSQQMPTLFASSEKNVQWIKVVTNDSIATCSSELYIFSLLKLPPPPRAAICYNLPINWGILRLQPTDPNLLVPSWDIQVMVPILFDLGSVYNPLHKPKNKRSFSHCSIESKMTSTLADVLNSFNWNVM